MSICLINGEFEEDQAVEEEDRKKDIETIE